MGKNTTIQIKSHHIEEILNFELTKIEYQLLLYLLSQIDTTNLVRLNKNEILAVKLNTTTRSITRAINKLEKSNLMKKTKFVGRTYMINPEFFNTKKNHEILVEVYNNEL